MSKDSPVRLGRVTTAADLPATGFVRMSQICPAIVPVQPGTIYQWIKKGTFPAPVTLGPNTRAFRVEDVKLWIAARGQA